MIASTLQRIRSDRGAVMIVIAAWMTSALALTTLVIDVGHWFEHKRHLQLQVDAGAFAGGQVFNGCLGATAAQRASSTSTANQAIVDEARRYAGDTNANAGAFNPQVSNRGNVTVLINAQNFANNGGANFDDPAGPPCQAMFVDLKATDANLPLFFSSSLVPAINAHARVSINQVSILAGSLPLAVQNVNPTDVAAIFVDEDAANFMTSTTAVLGTKHLVQDPTLSQSTLNGKSLIAWDNAGDPAAISVQSRDTGVIVALSGNPNWSLSGSVSTICAQTFVTCFAADPTSGVVSGGLQLIHGYATTSTATLTNPVVRDVSLYNVTCQDTSAPYFILHGDCTIGVRAKVDFGTGNVNPSLAPTNAQVKVARANNNNCPTSGSNPKGCPMTYNTTTGYWETTTTVPQMPANSGPLPITLNWGDSATTGTTAAIARPFTASDGSGPIEYATVQEGGVSTQSVAFGTHNFTVAVGIAGSLVNASNSSSPTVVLRFASAASSNSGTLDCDPPPRNFSDEVETGCQTPYQPISTGLDCPNSMSPASCIPTQTGNATGPLRSAMNARFAGCPPNRWPTAPGVTLPDFTNDPRAIPLIITSFGAFSNNGTHLVPVITFGQFYVTGWDQGNGAGVCGTSGPPGNEPFPGPGSQSGDVWGHFIKYIGNDPGSVGTVVCDLNAFSPCIPVLTD
jgi:hypothetical protein